MAPKPLICPDCGQYLFELVRHKCGERTEPPKESKCSSKLMKRRARIATAIAADIMRGYHGQAEQLRLIVNGRDDGGWDKERLELRIIMMLHEMEVT